MFKLVLDEYSVSTLEKHAEFTQRWIKGLRSGDYVQIQGAMVEDGVPNSACCLMVAECENGRMWTDHFKANTVGSIAGVPSCLESEHQWTETLTASVVCADSECACYTPEEWNDTLSLTFEEIADLLEFGVIELTMVARAERR